MSAPFYETAPDGKPQVVPVEDFDFDAIDTPTQEREPARDVATLARKMLAVVLAGRNGPAMRRRAALVAFLLCPSLVYPCRTRAELARVLGVSRAAVTFQLNKIKAELLDNTSKGRKIA